MTSEDSSLTLPTIDLAPVDDSPFCDILLGLASKAGRSEALVSRLLQATLRRSDRWISGPCNPWKYGVRKRHRLAIDYLLDHKHVWQPDIDLVWGPSVHGVRCTPIHAVELKHFALTKDRGRIIPKTRRGEGFYAGVGEALALTACGVDTISLWHVFQPPAQHWVALDGDAWDRAIDDYSEFCAAYTGKLSGLIMSLGLPIGYQCAGLMIGQDSDNEPIKASFFPLPASDVVAPVNPVRDSEHAQMARRHLMNILKVRADPAQDAIQSE